MKIDSIKKNFILNLIRLFLGSFFTVITMPYITRVLGSERLGRIEYALTITGYFLLITNLGISQYGIREVGKYRNDKYALANLLLELILIMLITTVLGSIIFYIYIQHINIDDKKLYYIFIFNMFFMNFGFEWFYQGIENQKYITIRYIIVRILALISIFLFIKKDSDYYKYALILMVMTSGSNIFNCLKIKKYFEIEKINLKKINLKKHLKPMIVILIGILAINIYYQLDITMIKYYGNNKDVAYYVIANKLVRLCIIITTAINIIMLPRLSNYYRFNKLKEYKKLLKYSLDYISFFVFPSVVGINLLTKGIIKIFSGTEFQNAEKLLQLLSYTIIFVSYHQYIGIQILSTKGEEKKYTKYLLIGACINLILNIVLGSIYNEIGITVATSISEGIILLLLLLYLKKRKEHILDKKELINIIKCASSSILSALFILYFMSFYNIRFNGLNFFLGAVIYILVYIFLLFIFKYEYIFLLKKYIRRQ